MYFMAKSRIHTVWPPENDQNVPYLSPLLPNSAKFCENIEIPRQLANFAARLKILCAAENCGPYQCDMNSTRVNVAGYLMITLLQFV